MQYHSVNEPREAERRRQGLADWYGASRSSGSVHAVRATSLTAAEWRRDTPPKLDRGHVSLTAGGGASIPRAPSDASSLTRAVAPMAVSVTLIDAGRTSPIGSGREQIAPHRG